MPVVHLNAEQRDSLGNIVVQIGPEGVILVDSGTTAMADKVLAAVRKLTPLPIRYIINTGMDADTFAASAGSVTSGSLPTPAR